ncbi:MAG TPA: hypothetical protein VGP68_05195, partial [Gemmataceae bacterium]|nr:hypothetical protein [Gemmataceae bacterium]
MASQWRIRHKLTLALGLVIANLAILLSGCLWGLISNSATMKSIHRKVEEQSSAEIVRQCVAGLSLGNVNPRPASDDQPRLVSGDQPRLIREQLEKTREALAAYKSQLRKSPKH